MLDPEKIDVVYNGVNDIFLPVNEEIKKNNKRTILREEMSILCLLALSTQEKTW